MHPLADEIVYSRRRTISLEISREAKLIVRLPKKADKVFVHSFIESKKEWVLKKKALKTKQMEELSGIEPAVYTKKDLEDSVHIIKKRLDLYSSVMGVKYDSFRLSNAKKRWGTCSRRADIKINWKLANAGEDILDYVIVHELAHIKEKNHSKRFWAIVAGILPDHKNRRKWLKDHGHKLHARYAD